MNVIKHHRQILGRPIKEVIASERYTWGSWLIWWLAAGGLLLLTVVNLIFLPLHPDTGWVFYVVNGLLDGKILYADILDTNPPLVYYLTLPSVWLARTIKWPAMVCFYSYIFFVMALAMGLCHRILKNNVGTFPLPVRQTLLLVLLFLFTIEIRLFFGKHEHVMLMLVIPYIFAAAGQAVGKPLHWPSGFLVGILAGIGFMTKPFYLLPWLMIELYLFFVHKQRQRWRSPENAGIFLAVLLYGLYLGLDGRFLRYIPTLLEAYTNIKRPFIGVLFRHLYIGVAAIIAVQIVKPQTPADRVLRQILLIVTVGFFAAGLYQQKNWYNHFYPAKAGAVLLITFVILRAAAKKPLAWQQGIALALTFLLFFQAVPPVVAGANRLSTTLQTDLVSGPNPFKAVGLFHTLSFKPDFAEIVGLVEQHTEAQDYIVQFGSTPYPAFPLVNYTHTRWSLPFTDLWPLTGLYRGRQSFRTIPEMDETEKYLMEAAVSEMVAHPPKLVLVLDRTNFDYIGYFSQDPRFAELWSNYVLLTQLTVFHIRGHQIQVFKHAGIDPTQ